MGDEDREEGKREAESEDGRELGKPEGGEVSPPVD
jgi:hypothetical protein